MILKIKDFEFEYYDHKGDSGQKYIATRKSDGKKFIVKHEYPDSACNEFVYFSMTKLLEIKTLEFHLFEKDKSCKIFKSVLQLQ